MNWPGEANNSWISYRAVKGIRLVAPDTVALPLRGFSKGRSQKPPVPMESGRKDSRRCSLVCKTLARGSGLSELPQLLECGCLLCRFWIGSAPLLTASHPLLPPSELLGHQLRPLI